MSPVCFLQLSPSTRTPPLLSACCCCLASPMSKKKSFFVGPQKVVAPKKTEPQPTTPATPQAPPPPTRRRPRTDPVAEAQLTFLRGVQTHREHFQHFLRSSLALLDPDIVQTIVTEFDNHCVCEDRVVESASHYLSKATRNRIIPELRHFQLIMDASETSCTEECLHEIRAQREVTISQSRTEDLEAILMPPEKGGIHAGSQVDLTLIGAVNDILVWGEQLRSALLVGYRKGEAGMTLGDALGGGNSNSSGGSRGSGGSGGSGGSSTHRPSTAPLRRRKTPAKRHFQNGATETNQHRNVYARPASAKMTRKNNAMQSLPRPGSDREGGNKLERRLLRQTLGSYYSYDSSNSSNLNSLLSSSSSGYNSGVRHSLPSQRKNNPNSSSKRRSKQRAKNKIDLASYNAFHASPMLRVNSSFDGPRRSIPRSSSTSTTEMQTKSLLRGLRGHNNSMDSNAERVKIEMPSGDVINRELADGFDLDNNDNNESTTSVARGHTNNNAQQRRKTNADSFDRTKSLRAIKSRHGGSKKKNRKKNSGGGSIGGW